MYHLGLCSRTLCLLVAVFLYGLCLLQRDISLMGVRTIIVDNIFSNMFEGGKKKIMHSKNCAIY